MKKFYTLSIPFLSFTTLMAMDVEPLSPEDAALQDLLTFHNKTVKDVPPFPFNPKVLQAIQKGLDDMPVSDLPDDMEERVCYLAAFAKNQGTPDLDVLRQVSDLAAQQGKPFDGIDITAILLQTKFFLAYEHVKNSRTPTPPVPLATAVAVDEEAAHGEGTGMDIPDDLKDIPPEHLAAIQKTLQLRFMEKLDHPGRATVIAQFKKQKGIGIKGGGGLFSGIVTSAEKDRQAAISSMEKDKEAALAEQEKEPPTGTEVSQLGQMLLNSVQITAAGDDSPSGSDTDGDWGPKKKGKTKPKFSPTPPVATPPVDEFAGLSEAHMIELQEKLDRSPGVPPPLRQKIIDKFKAEKGITAPTASAGPMGGGLFAGLADAAKKDRKAAVDAVDKPKTPAKRGDSDGGGESGGARPKPKFSPPQAVAAPLVDPLAGLTEEQKEEVRAKIALTGLGHLPLTTPPVAAVINKYKTEKGITAPTASAGPMGGGLLGALKAVPQKDRTAALAGLGKPKTPSKSEGGDSGKGTGAPGGSTPVAAQFVVSPEALKQTNRGSGTAFDADRIKEDARRVREAREKKAAEDAAREAAKGPPRPNFVIPVKPKPVPGSVVPPPPPMTVTSGGRPPATTTGWMAKKPTAAASGGSKPPVAATMAVPERAAIDEEKLDAIITSLAKSFPADPVKEETVRQGYLSALATQEPISYLTQQIWENLEKFNRAANAIFRTQAMRAIKVAMDMLAERGDTRPLREIAGFDTDPGVGVVSGDGDKD